MYAKPPNVASASAAIPGAGTTTVTIVTAPGVGIRLRLVGGQICINRAAGANGDITIRDAVAVLDVVRAFGLTNAGGGGSTVLPFIIPEPGYLFADNSAMNLLCTSTAAVGTFSATVYYYFDTVT